MGTPVDIVLPCYNPGGSWHMELMSFHKALCQSYDLRYIIVNDGSTNPAVAGQIELLTRSGITVRYIAYPLNKGKGYALREGVKSTTSRYVVYTDIDFPFTNESVLSVISSLVTGGCDVAAGCRETGYYQKSMTTFRKVLSKAFRFFIKRILKIEIGDTQCGLKGFNESGKKKFLATTVNRYLFDFEFIYAASRDKSIRILPVGVRLKDNVVFSKMKLKIVLQEILNLFAVLVLRKAR